VSASCPSWPTTSKQKCTLRRRGSELPRTGERLEGSIPPVVASPAFDAVMQRRNVLVAGAASIGKTTLVNELLADVAATSDRVLLIEHARELQSKAPNLVALRTRDGVASLRRVL
jgi:type IV secretion system protein TrbB